MMKMKYIREIVLEVAESLCWCTFILILTHLNCKNVGNSMVIPLKNAALSWKTIKWREFLIITK